MREQREKKQTVYAVVMPNLEHSGISGPLGETYREIPKLRRIIASSYDHAVAKHVMGHSPNSGSTILGILKEKNRGLDRFAFQVPSELFDDDGRKLPSWETGKYGLTFLATEIATVEGRGRPNNADYNLAKDLMNLPIN